MRVKEQLSPLLDAEDSKTSRDKEKDEVLNDFFSSVSNTKTSCCQVTQLPEVSDGEWNLHNPGRKDYACYAN